MPDFLFEIGSEEIPSRFQKEAKEQLNTLAQTCLLPCLHAQSVETFVTPRRLCVILKKVELVSEQPYEKQGPSVSAGEKALAGFCRSFGVTPEDCFQRETPKGLVWAAQIVPKAKKIEEELVAFCKRILGEFFWPKRMRWGAGVTWVRPIRTLLCLLDEKPLVWEWHGLTSGSVTHGHRLCPLNHSVSQEKQELSGSSTEHYTRAIAKTRAPALCIDSPQTYESQLRQALVEVHFDKREETIDRALCELAQEVNCTLYTHELSQLIEENAGLTQWPTAMRGAFDPRFLQLPEEVIATTLQVHQRCFCLKDGTTGTLAPYFVMIADGVFSQDKVLRGYERVVDARLSDALFFWHKDRRQPLSFYTSLLEGRLFFQGLGTLAQKVERLQSLVSSLCKETGIPEQTESAVQAACLSKSDLVTSLVGEFGTLQGVVGKYYALHDGMNPVIANALEDQYHFHNLSCNQTNKDKTLGALLAIADGVDTLVGFFALGRIPSGSKDPMALRRAAHSVIRACIVSKLLPFSMRAFIAYALSCYHRQGYLVDVPHVNHLWSDFFKDRLVYVLKEDLEFSEVHVSAALIDDTIAGIIERVEALTACLHAAPTFLQAYRRVYSLTCHMKDQEAVWDGSALTLPQEVRLLDLLDRPLNEVDFSLWAEALTDFFDEVRVNDPVYQSARLALLHKVLAFFATFGNFFEFLPH